jgi:two-component system, OmpR family, response regulator
LTPDRLGSRGRPRRRFKLSEILRYADVTLDERRHEVVRAGVRVELTPREFELLGFFLLNPQRVLSKQQILDNVWPQDFRGSAEIVERYVSYLRRKLHASGPPLIRTVRQSGYVLELPD